MKLKINPEALAARYIELLERDLKLERQRLETARHDVEFYRGKCERLEMAVLNTQPAAVGQDYVRRTEPKRPSIGQVKLEGALKPKFHEIRDKWNALSQEDQEKAMKDGWSFDGENRKEG